MTTKAMTKHNSNCKRNRKKGHQITGAVIAIVGFFWFAKKIGWIPVAASGSVIFWPAVTIAAGVAIFLSASRNRKEEN
jgi:hypothetical protein